MLILLFKVNNFFLKQEEIYNQANISTTQATFDIDGILIMDFI